MSVDLREDLIRLSNEFGADVEYSRAGGGNSSVKQDGVLWIKPSGVALATLRAEDLVPLRISTLLEALYSDEPAEGDPVQVAAAAARIGDPGGRRPSVEILFHALLPEPLVLHLHPLVANAVTCNRDGRKLAAELLGDEAVWVDYIDPGVPLARGIDAARREYEERTGRPAPGITLLGNHGIIVGGKDYGEVAERTRWVTETIQAAIDAAPPPDDEAPELTVDVGAIAEAFRDAVGAEAVATSSDVFTRANSGLGSGPVSRGPLIPDQIVYSGSFPVRLPDDPDRVAPTVEEYRSERRRQPVSAVVAGQAALAVGKTDKAARNALDTFLDALRVARDADRLGEVRVMDERERHFIENWEAEAYRQSVSDSG